MKEPNYYDTLGLNPDAPTAEIKSRYRKLAMRFHPDRNPNDPEADRKFQAVHVAYKTLGDPDSRAEYDRTFGWKAGGTATSHRNGRNYRYYDHRSRPRVRFTPNRPFVRPSQPREAYNLYKVQVSLPELFKGARRSLVVGETFTCGRCLGTGRMEYGESCRLCGAYGFLVSFRRVEVVIPPGIMPDMRMHLTLAESEYDDTVQTALSGNINVQVELKDSTPFEYRDQKLCITTIVPQELLAEGGKWAIPSPEGGNLELTIPPDTASGTILTLRKQGLRSGSSQRRGNLLLTVLSDNTLSDMPEPAGGYNPARNGHQNGVEQ